MQSVEESLIRLGVKYLDIVQLHDVEFCASNQQLLSHTIPALLKLKKAGKIKHIGVTGYPLDILKDLVRGGGLVPLCKTIFFGFVANRLPISHSSSP